MRPSTEMEPQDELQQLMARQAALKQELAAKKKALQEAQRRQRHTRRLILIGSYVDSVSQADPASMTRLRKGLDEFLEHNQDRPLFDLAPRPKDA